MPRGAANTPERYSIERGRPMNTPILTCADARIDEGHVGQGSQPELSSTRPESWRAKLLDVTLAISILALVALSTSGIAAKARCVGVQVHPAEVLTQVATAHAEVTTYCNKPGAEKTTKRGALIAGRHLAYSTRAG
jgi:hypothetical protein